VTGPVPMRLDAEAQVAGHQIAGSDRTARVPCEACRDLKRLLYAQDESRVGRGKGPADPHQKRETLRRVGVGRIVCGTESEWSTRDPPNPPNPFRLK
jgi:hypothetical protein